MITVNTPTSTGFLTMPRSNPLERGRGVVDLFIVNDRDGASRGLAGAMAPLMMEIFLKIPLII
jgi:hypothetical protein